jgi:hypothetical protein
MKTRYLGLLVGVWYLLAPFVWGYPMGFLWWHSILIGSVIVAVSASYMMSWNRGGSWTSQFAFWNDLFFGVITIGLGVALGGAAIEYGGEEEVPAG